MRVNFILALLLLIIAVIMYILPQSVLQDFRLQIFNEYSNLINKANTFNPKQGSKLTSSIPVEVQLKELLTTLEKKDSEIAFLKKQLREFTEFKELYPNIKITSAKIISESTNSTSPELIIDKGYLDGVVEGAAVAQGETIAGVVVRVERNTSIILRADNPGVLIPARAGKSRDRCSIKGNGYELGTAIFYTGQTVSMVGERIYTSSALGKIPEGLFVGILEDYPQKGDEPGTLEAPVKLAADFTSLEYVIIISEF